MKTPETLDLQLLAPARKGPRVFPQDCVNCVNLESFLLRKMNADAKGLGL